MNNNYDDIIEINNKRIEKLTIKNDNNKFLKKEMALCTAGSLAFIGAAISMNDAYGAAFIGSLITGGLAFGGAIGTFCSRVDDENEIYYLKHRNEFYKSLNDTKVLKK